eukprot:2514937-Amphidinium_carterae.1
MVRTVRTDGSRKHPLVWDLRRSGDCGVNDELDQVQRIILPRLRDVVDDSLQIANGVNVKRPPLLTVASVSDAFHLLPVNEKELLYQTVGYRGKLYVFRVLVFGSRVAPTLWGRTGAFLARSAQSLVPDGVTRVELYVDDPIILVAGPHAEMNTKIILLRWMVLGAPIAWNKAAQGYHVDWIGAHLHSMAGELLIGIPHKKVHEIK